VMLPGLTSVGAGAAAGRGVCAAPGNASNVATSTERTIFMGEF
jgi:hypothetical protein